MSADPITLAIETSCDDTSAAVLHGKKILSNLVSSQITDKKFAGIVPELAARAHQANILPVVSTAMRQAQIGTNDLDLIAVTYGPGLIGSLLVGLNAAKGIAFSLKKPLIGVNHIEAHLLACFLEPDPPEFPFIALVVSGGHTLLACAKDTGQYEWLGETYDDAAGECFDKVARLLGLQPERGSMMGGPIIDQRARSGDPAKFVFPRPMMKEKNLDFSFSGLKTSVMNYLRSLSRDEIDANMDDLCASFQEAVVEVLVSKSIRACQMRNVPRLVISGGVAANSRLKLQIDEEGHRRGIRAYIPSKQFCTDNAAMIGLAGQMNFHRSGPSPNTLAPQPALTLNLSEL